MTIKSEYILVAQEILQLEIMLVVLIELDLTVYS